MPSNGLWAGALSQLLIFQERGCRHSALHAIRLLENLSGFDGVDEDLRLLCERAIPLLEDKLRGQCRRLTG